VSVDALYAAITSLTDCASLLFRKKNQKGRAVADITKWDFAMNAWCAPMTKELE
jgi:hypothetical protein